MQEKMKQIVENFRLPRYDEIPDVGLYLEQVAKYISGFCSPLFGESLTPAMISNYVKKGLIENPVNPFTGKPVTTEEKFAHEQMIMTSRDVAVQDSTGEVFLPSFWASVKDDIWEKENWSFGTEKAVLAEHKLP